MPIFEPQDMSFANKFLTIIVQGAPGTGKTFLGCSAYKVLILDFDNQGISRVNKDYRKPASFCKDFDEVKADIEAAKGKYETIVIDTGGALVEMLKKYVVDHPKDFKGGAKSMGGISLQGFGFVKQLWNDFIADLRRNFNVVILFHESIEKNNDDGNFYQIVCEGSTRNTVYQSADLAARLFINNGQRYLGFTPTEQYSAKACYGISGIIPVPELKDGEPNDFLTKLFAKVHKNLEDETKQLAPEKAKYDETMVEARKLISMIEKPEDVSECVKIIKQLDHALTSEKESTALLKARLAELNIVWDKSAKAYKYAESKGN